MLSMGQRIENLGGCTLHVAYDARATLVVISTSDGNSNRVSASFGVEEFDKLVEQYMYLRQFTNGRRVR